MEDMVLDKDNKEKQVLNNEHKDHEHHEHLGHMHEETGHMDHGHMKHKHEEMEHMDHEHMGHEGGHGGGMGGHGHHAMMVQDFKRRFFISLLLTVPILILSPVIQGFFGLDLGFAADSYVVFILSTILYFFGGKPFLTGARDELRQKAPAMMTLIAFAITVSYVYSALTVFVLEGMDFFWELATLITIMLLGHWIEMRSVMGASMALEELAKLLPEEAHLIGEDGALTDVPVDALKTGDMVLVKPGEKVPVDGIVVEGRSSINESMITGESVPVDKQGGDEIIGGSVNGEGALRYRISRVGEETFLSQVIKLVREAQESKSETQRLADTAARALFYIAVLAGCITFAVWMAIGYGLNFSITRAVTVIVICCPHALGLAIPLVTAVSTSIGAKQGLIVRNRAAFENARNLDAIVFDKTGTLTEGKFGVSDIQAAQMGEDALLALASSVEINSEHLIAKGIVEEAQHRNLELNQSKDHLTIPGKGLKAVVDGKEVMVVSPGYLEEEGISYDREAYGTLAGQGKTVVFVLVDGRLAGYLALSDMVRESAREAIVQLKSMDIQTVMLTGDNEKAASYVANKLGIDKMFAEMLPQQKVETIDALRSEGKIVAMTGDGINDAPSLAKADLGIAIGAGTDVAVETADVILVKNNPVDVINIIKLSKAIYRKMIQNLIWATGYNAIALPLAAGVLFNWGIVLNPAVGAVLMSLSTIIVAINARMLKI